MEEELFGRTDVDSAEAELRSRDPMHPSMLSEPMRWLAEAPGRLVPAAGADWTEAAIGRHFAWTRGCSRSSRRSVLNICQKGSAWHVATKTVRLAVDVP